ncbi:MAG: hypothetical protein AB7I44_21155 [Hyphomicrobiaceae bacterium]
MTSVKKNEPKVELSLVESLTKEAVDVLMELLDALETQANENPGEHNVEPSQNVRKAIIALHPNAL